MQGRLSSGSRIRPAPPHSLRPQPRLRPLLRLRPATSRAEGYTEPAGHRLGRGLKAQPTAAGEGCGAPAPRPQSRRPSQEWPGPRGEGSLGTRKDAEGGTSGWEQLSRINTDQKAHVQQQPGEWAGSRKGARAQLLAGGHSLPSPPTLPTPPLLGSGGRGVRSTPPTPPPQPLKKCVLLVSTWGPVLQEGSPRTASRVSCQNSPWCPVWGDASPGPVPLAQGRGPSAPTVAALGRASMGAGTADACGHACDLAVDTVPGGRPVGQHRALIGWGAPVSIEIKTQTTGPEGQMARMVFRPLGDWPVQPGKAHMSTVGAQARGAVACPHPRGCSGGTGRTHVWWAQAKVGHSAVLDVCQLVRTPPCPQAPGPCMRTSDGQQPPKPGIVFLGDPQEPPQSPCSKPLRAESREGWGRREPRAETPCPRRVDTPTPLVSQTPAAGESGREAGRRSPLL